ncbi:MAG: hypothetical protein IJ637_03185 [Prevotella sp.]|nr:hypothetical protein [Prevotella sp.]
MMKPEELRQLFAMLRRAGVRPMLCDTEVPMSSCPVKCGLPTAAGDVEIDNVMLPKALVGINPEIFIPACGDSMLDAGYEEGDHLRVRLGVDVHDGDNVLAMVDGECTVKTFFTDDDGQRWLVPRNDNYNAILLTEQMNVRLLGRVMAVEKLSPKTSYRDCLRAVRRTKAASATGSRLSEQRVDDVIRSIGQEVRHARQWYAVMRAMIDGRVVEEGCYALFCQRVGSVLAEHGHLPTAKELQRMAVQSFAKPVALWNRNNAPVSGLRFDDYLRIARHTAEALAA